MPVPIQNSLFFPLEIITDFECQILHLLLYLLFFYFPFFTVFRPLQFFNMDARGDLVGPRPFLQRSRSVCPHPVTFGVVEGCGTQDSCVLLCEWDLSPVPFHGTCPLLPPLRIGVNFILLTL
jgi:hypothetical protein